MQLTLRTNDWLTPFWRMFNDDYGIFTFTPDIVKEDGADSVKVKFNLAGYKKENIKVTYRDNLVRVTAEQDKNKYNSSYRLTGYKINELGITAEYTDGVLTVTLPFCVMALAEETKVEIK